MRLFQSQIHVSPLSVVLSSAVRLTTLNNPDDYITTILVGLVKRNSARRRFARSNGEYQPLSGRREIRRRIKSSSRPAQAALSSQSAKAKQVVAESSLTAPPKEPHSRAAPKLYQSQE